MDIACIIDNDFEDVEYRIPHDRLTAAGYTVVNIGRRQGDEVTGKHGKERVRIERSIDDASPDDYTALFIPGGFSPDRLRADPRFVDFVRGFEQRGKLIAAVCHGPQLLISAGLVRGRTLTSWRTVQEDLRQAGAHVLDQEVVEDGNWVTSRQPSDLEAFSRAVLARLGAGAGAHP